MCTRRLFLCVIVYFGYVRGEYLNIPEGSSCSFNGVTGICASIYKCMSADFDINRKMNPPICEFDGSDPILCCTDCNLVNDTRNVITNPNLGFLHLNGEKAHDQCFNYIDQLPYRCKLQTNSRRQSVLNENKSCYNHVSNTVSDDGGAPANGDEYPHMALLGFGEDWLYAKWLGSGTVISHRFVLTSAYCIEHPQYGAVSYFGVGLVRQSDPPGLWHRYRVSRHIIHPEYKPPSFYHNIALLEAGTPIIFNDKVMPACLTPPTRPLGADLQDDDEATLTSWGTLKPKGLDFLLTIPLDKFSEEECMKEYPPQPNLEGGYNHTTQMCYGRRDDVLDSCESGTGGPLQFTPFCTSTVIGVTIVGRGCGKPAISTRASIYTRVSYYLPWIEGHVWP